MKREWVIKRIEAKVFDPTTASLDEYRTHRYGSECYYAGKHKHGDNPIKDMFAMFATVNADKIKIYPNQATAVIALQEIKEPGRYIIESHFIIEEE